MELHNLITELSMYPAVELHNQLWSSIITKFYSLFYSIVKLNFIPYQYIIMTFYFVLLYLTCTSMNQAS